MQFSEKKNEYSIGLLEYSLLFNAAVDMHVVGKSNQKYRSIGKFNVEKFYPRLQVLLNTTLRSFQLRVGPVVAVECIW